MGTTNQNPGAGDLLRDINAIIVKNARAINIAAMAVIFFLFCAGNIVVANFGYGISAGASGLKAITEMENIFKFAGAAGFSFGMFMFVVCMIAIVVSLVLSLIAFLHNDLAKLAKWSLCLLALYAIAVFMILVTNHVNVGFLGGWLALLFSAAWYYCLRVQKEAAGK